MLTHLYEAFAVISNADWLANDKCFRNPYSPTVPIEVAWQQIDDAVVYTNTGSMPYSSKQVMDNAYQIMFNTVIFAADYWEWNKRAADNKTLSHLKVFFAASNRESCISL